MPRRLFRLALLSALTLTLTTPPLAAQDPRAVAWGRRAEAIADDLAAGKHQRALRASDKLSEEMKQAVGAGEKTAQALALVQLYRAVSHHGLGNEDDALWYWSLAINLWPGIEKLDLSHLGEKARELAEERRAKRAEQRDDETASEALGQPEDRSGDLSELEVTPPKKLNAPAPKYPLGARHLRVTGSMVVQTIIDKQGRVREPRVLVALPAPSLTLEALEKLREWRFEPARLDGEPVDVYYNLSINFELRN